MKMSHACCALQPSSLVPPLLLLFAAPACRLARQPLLRPNQLKDDGHLLLHAVHCFHHDCCCCCCCCCLPHLLQAGQAAPVAPKSATKAKAEKVQLSAEAQAAVAAVDAAARALPELDPDEIVFMKNEGFGGAVDMEPSAPGSKVGMTGISLLFWVQDLCRIRQLLWVQI
jgi:hypothetical protein